MEKFTNIIPREFNSNQNSTMNNNNNMNMINMNNPNISSTSSSMNRQGNCSSPIRRRLPPQQAQQPQPEDTKNIFINEIRERVEAYFKLIVRNLRDSIQKTIGNHLVKSIELHMQMSLYNMLYQQRELVNVLNEPESVMLRRKDLTEQIKVMKEAQKVIKRDPDLMSVMQININDSDISGHTKEAKPAASSNLNINKK